MSDWLIAFVSQMCILIVIIWSVDVATLMYSMYNQK